MVFSTEGVQCAPRPHAILQHMQLPESSLHVTQISACRRLHALMLYLL